MQNDVSEAIAVFRDYIATISSYRKTNSDIYPISTGYPLDGVCKLPTNMLNALSPIQNEVEIDRYGYGWNFDTDSLKRVVINYEAAKTNIHYEKEEVALTLGGTHGLNIVLSWLEEKIDGDFSILAIGPTFFRLFGETVRRLSITTVQGKEDNDFLPSYEEIIEAIGVKTKVIFLCNPSNPTYKMFPLETLKKLIDFCIENGIYLVIDEVGDAFRQPQASDYKYPKNIDTKNVIRICSASKTFLLAEYRLGYVLGDEEMIADLSRSVSNNISHIGYGGCMGWAFGLENETDRLLSSNKNSEYSKNYVDNVNILSRCLKTAIEGLEQSRNVTKIIHPDACFSFVFKINSSKFETDVKLFKSLLEEKSVSIVPGSGFGIDPSKKYFRVTYAYPEKKLKEAIKLINEFVDNVAN